MSFISCTIIIKDAQISFFLMKGQNMEYDDAIPMTASSKNYINSNYEIWKEYK